MKAASEKAAAKKAVEGFDFDFNAKRSSTSFNFGDIKPTGVKIEAMSIGKKDPSKRFYKLIIDGTPYMIEGGDLNTSMNFKLVCEPTAKAAGKINLVAGVRISSTSGVIAWSVAA